MVFSWFNLFKAFPTSASQWPSPFAFSYRVGSFILCSDMSSVLIECVFLVEPLLTITQFFYHFQFLKIFELFVLPRSICLTEFVCTTTMPVTGAGVKDGCELQCDAKNQTPVLCNSNNCSWLLPYLSSPNYNHLENYSFFQWSALPTESVDDSLRTQLWASSCLHCLEVLQ